MNDHCKTLKAAKDIDEQYYREFLLSSEKAETNIFIGEDNKVLAVALLFNYDKHWVSEPMILEVQEACGNAIGAIIARELNKISGSGGGKEN